jgi:DNA polymerase III delta prime subunit
VKLFKRENYIPPIIYYVNANSKVDIIDQCVPFINDLEKLDYSDNDIEIIVYHDENGHQSRISYEEAYPLLQMVLKRKAYRYFNKSPFPDKKIEEISRENHELKNELDNLKSKKIFKLDNKLQNLKKKLFRN